MVLNVSLLNIIQVHGHAIEGPYYSSIVLCCAECQETQKHQ